MLRFPILIHEVKFWIKKLKQEKKVFSLLNWKKVCFLEPTATAEKKKKDLHHSFWVPSSANLLPQPTLALNQTLTRAQCEAGAIVLANQTMFWFPKLNSFFLCWAEQSLSFFRTNSWKEKKQKFYILHVFWILPSANLLPQPTLTLNQPQPVPSAKQAL